MSVSTYKTGLSSPPSGFCFDKSNNFYVTSGNTILKFDTLGNQTTFASGFNNDGVQYIIFDNTGFPSGYMYVMDKIGIYKLDVNGNKTTFSTGLGLHFFGMVFDVNNNLYYSSSNGIIHKITTSGTISNFINDTKTLSYPNGLAFDSTGNLYIANSSSSDSKRVSKYNSTGTTIINESFISTPGNSFANLIIDSNNNIYTLALGNNNTKSYFSKYDNIGTLISNISILSVSTSNTLTGLAFDNAGNVYFQTSLSSISVYTPNPSVTCFKEDTKILTLKGYVPIQNLRKGDFVKTLQNSYIPINMIGKRKMFNSGDTERIKDRLYVCKNEEYPEIFEELVITGCHSILVEEFNGNEKKKTEEILGDIYLTEDKYRLPACVDERAKPYEEKGEFTIYHIALDNDDYYMNYGVYANGLLVETCSQRYLKEISEMELIN
jgi:hypothetical protein